MVLIKGIKLGLYIYNLNFCFALFGLWKGGTCSVNEKKDNSIWSNDFSVYIIVTYFFINVSDISFQIFPFSSIIQKCIHLRVNIVILDIAFVKSVFPHIYLEIIFTKHAIPITLEVIFHFYIHVNIINKNIFYSCFEEIIKIKSSSDIFYFTGQSQYKIQTDTIF